MTITLGVSGLGEGQAVWLQLGLVYSYDFSVTIKVILIVQLGTVSVPVN